MIDHEVIFQFSGNGERGSHERQLGFRHILIQQIIYNSVLLRRRDQLHHKIAAAIEELYPDRLDEQAERLAFHYGESKARGARTAARHSFGGTRGVAVCK